MQKLEKTSQTFFANVCNILATIIYTNFTYRLRFLYCTQLLTYFILILIRLLQELVI